jgi:thiamine-phosphate pyrophosphorylase
MAAAPTDNPGSRRRLRAARLGGLYAVTPDTRDTADLAARVAAAIAGGATAIQYRNKTADGATRRAQAGALAGIAAARGALFIVNDDPALAAAVDADGVHLGEGDGGIDAARALLGPDAIVGVSCYDDGARGEAAVAAGADYVAFGSFFPSAVKPGARRADVALLRRAAGLAVPVVAIGGITADNAGTLFAAGADAVAVISAVFAAPDAAGVERAARRLCAAAPRRPAIPAARIPNAADNPGEPKA